MQIHYPTKQYSFPKSTTMERPIKSFKNNTKKRIRFHYCLRVCHRLPKHSTYSHSPSARQRIVFYGSLPQQKCESKKKILSTDYRLGIPHRHHPNKWICLQHSVAAWRLPVEVSYHTNQCHRPFVRSQGKSECIMMCKVERKSSSKQKKKFPYV